MSELALLQAVRLKGRVNHADLAETLSEDPADVGTTVTRLTKSGLLVNDKTMKLSPEGRARLGELLAEERRSIDGAAMTGIHNDFRAVNAEFKAVVTDWQVKAGEPNTHDDTEYDASIVTRLDRVHQRVVPIVAAAAAQLPRLGTYSAKLQKALDRVKAGEIAWLSRPIIDSYHTVWFELHEELILAAGLTREAEARSGDAQ
jgi:DNA-binding MarR family transcriptional regulator